MTQLINAQTEVTSSKIKVYVPSDNGTSSNSYKWTVKTDLFSFLVGEFPIIGEYRIDDKLSIEASAGITYAFWPNGISFFEALDGSVDSNFDPGLGSAFRLGIKYYPSSHWDAIEGWAFGIIAFTVTNNRTLKNFDPAFPVDFTDSETKTGAMITISNQIFWDSNISYEYLIGVGFSSNKREYIGIDYNSVNSSIILFTEENTAPTFKFGVRIGFGN